MIETTVYILGWINVAVYFVAGIYGAIVVYTGAWAPDFDNEFRTLQTATCFSAPAAFLMSLSHALYMLDGWRALTIVSNAAFFIAHIVLAAFTLTVHRYALAEIMKARACARD